MDKKTAPALNDNQSAVVRDVTKSTAARIKFLRDEQFDRADISRIMTKYSGKSVSYQWVKNVLDKA